MVKRIVSIFIVISILITALSTVTFAEVHSGKIGDIGNVSWSVDTT